MSTLAEKVHDFLAQKNIAVVGVSRQGGSETANVIYRKLRDSGYHVYAINPQADTVENDPCYPTLAALPQAVEGVVIATPPQAAPQIMQACIDLNIRHVWMHRSFGTGSVSDEATALGEAHGLSVIAGGCPMMFCEPVDLAHKCIRWAVNMTGGLPR